MRNFNNHANQPLNLTARGGSFVVLFILQLADRLVVERSSETSTKKGFPGLS